MITLSHADTIIASALAKGRESGFAPLCVAVLDAGGHLIALKREDGASINRPQIAMAKASGCIGMGFGGREMKRRAETMPAFMAALNGLFPNGALPVPGGVLVRDTAGKLIGAIGVTGDVSENDEVCAVAGIIAAGLVADTGD